ncbi:type II toxin-antitoxin system RelE/ParE family toxin [Caulobacter sp. BK020]|uniref:type II toxin-antitoxin system RelE/ParE family toxin n=1 Tax=Caulobacter sp. BK020 TaxID=2512117 RepID=UPI0010E040EC|nr:type II toxin-antitoxin system RelE/ParE family toxin [Caulobacter sp. BK020]TCS14012.1 plasmid stabilization system protein ParE [Caulobacter sp. BK020]
MIAFSRATAGSVLARPVHVSAQAERDIERLHDWLLERSPAAAIRLIALLEESFESLSQFSDRGRLVDDRIRELIVPFGGSSYVIRYEADAAGVLVSRVWHGLEDR